MNLNGWIQLALFVAALLLITKPLGLHLTRVLDARGKTFLDPIFKPLERLTYKVLRVDPEQERLDRGVYLLLAELAGQS